MKKLTFLFLLLSSISYSQDLREKIILDKIDSLQKAIDLELKTIDILNIKLKLAKKELDNYYLKTALGEKYVCIQGTFIIKTPDSYETICKLNSGDTVKVAEILSNHYKVFLGKTCGYVIKSALEKQTDFLAKQQAKTDKEKKLEKDKKDSEAKRKDELVKRKKELISKYGQEIGLKIYEGRIWIGATKEMIIEIKGRPTEINRTVGSWGTHEQWVYDNSYLYFENDILTSWQD